MATGCALGQRPTIVETPTAVGMMTGDPAIDDVLERFDAEAGAVFAADYTAVLAFGSTTSTVTVTQDGSEPTAIRRSVTVGDVRYISTPEQHFHLLGDRCPVRQRHRCVACQ